MYHLLFYFFALSIERTRPDLHFTTDYTLYDCVCDNKQEPWTLNLMKSVKFFDLYEIPHVQLQN